MSDIQSRIDALRRKAQDSAVGPDERAAYEAKAKELEDKYAGELKATPTVPSFIIADTVMYTHFYDNHWQSGKTYFFNMQYGKNVKHEEDIVEEDYQWVIIDLENGSTNMDIEREE